MAQECEARVRVRVRARVGLQACCALQHLRQRLDVAVHPQERPPRVRRLDGVRVAGQSRVLGCQLLHRQVSGRGPGQLIEHLTQGGLRRELAAGDRIRQERCGERLRDRADLELVVLARVPAGEKDRAVGLDRGRRDAAQIALVEVRGEGGGELRVALRRAGEAALPRDEGRAGDQGDRGEGACQDAAPHDVAAMRRASSGMVRSPGTSQRPRRGERSQPAAASWFRWW